MIDCNVVVPIPVTGVVWKITRKGTSKTSNFRILKSSGPIKGCGTKPNHMFTSKNWIWLNQFLTSRTSETLVRFPEDNLVSFDSNSKTWSKTKNSSFRTCLSITSEEISIVELGETEDHFSKTWIKSFSTFRSQDKLARPPEDNSKTWTSMMSS